MVAGLRVVINIVIVIVVINLLLRTLNLAKGFGNPHHWPAALAYT